MYGNEPIPEWQLRTMHHRAGAQRSAVPAMLALVLLLAFKPHHILAPAMLAGNTLADSHLLESFAAGLLVRKVGCEIKQLHCIYFINAIQR